VPERKTYSVEEVALAYQVHSRTVVNMVRAGDLDGVKVGGQLRVVADSLPIPIGEAPTYAPKHRVYAALAGRNISLAALAEKLRADRRYVGEIIAGVAGRRGRKAQTIREGIAKFLKIPYEELWAE